jgi:hypothetical protein
MLLICGGWLAATGCPVLGDVPWMEISHFNVR